jgi:ribosomal protein S6--L-glutamate ligase
LILLLNKLEFKKKMQDQKKCFIALGSRLSGIPEVLTLGVKSNFFDYSSYERDLILGSDIILYPTLNYSQFLTTIGKHIFPTLETYIYADEKIKQTTLFNMAGIPHPRTKVYFHLHHNDILKDFNFPFIAKLPRNSSQGRGIFKIENNDDLNKYLQLTDVAYVQEYIPHERDLRVILINYQVVLAYWRERSLKTFKTNIYQGGKINFNNIDEEGLFLARDFAKKCKLNDVGLDMIKLNGKWHLIEANMKYGTKALRLKKIDHKQVVREKLLSGELDL